MEQNGHMKYENDVYKSEMYGSELWRMVLPYCFTYNSTSSVVEVYNRDYHIINKFRIKLTQKQIAECNFKPLTEGFYSSQIFFYNDDCKPFSTEQATIDYFRRLEVLLKRQQIEPKNAFRI